MFIWLLLHVYVYIYIRTLKGQYKGERRYMMCMYLFSWYIDSVGCSSYSLVELYVMSVYKDVCVYIMMCMQIQCV